MNFTAAALAVTGLPLRELAGHFISLLFWLSLEV